MTLREAGFTPAGTGDRWEFVTDDKGLISYVPGTLMFAADLDESIKAEAIRQLPGGVGLCECMGRCWVDGGEWIDAEYLEHQHKHTRQLEAWLAKRVRPGQEAV